MKKTKKKSFLVPIIFMLAGIGIVVFITITTVNANDFQKTASQTTAIVTKIKEVVREDTDGNDYTEHTVYVVFTVNGKEYSGVYNDYHSSMNQGSQVKVYYNPDNPSEFYAEVSIASAVGVGIAGSAVFLVGVLLMIAINKKDKTNQLHTDDKQDNAEDADDKLVVSDG